MVITSKSNPLVKKIASLADKKYRRLYGLYIVEGIKPVNECIAVGCEIDCIVACEQFAGQYEKLVLVSESVFLSLSEEKTPQGVLAVVKIPQTPIQPPHGNCLLLDNIQDPGNMGTIVRTANAAGYRELYLVDCVDPYSTKAVRASMSGIFFATVYTGTRAEVLNVLKDVPLISADMGGEDIFDFVPPEQYCLCIGNEGNGLSEEVKRASRYVVKIPMEATCESLNAGVSAGIAMYALKRNQRKNEV
jgi:TrmH family RNA methyltransferase